MTVSSSALGWAASTNSLQPNRPSPYVVNLPYRVYHPRISPQAAVRNSFVLGDVTIEPWAHVVNATIRADEGSPFYIGPYSNVQDGVVIHAHSSQKNGIPVNDNRVYVPGKGWYSVFIGQNSSVAHQALIHGPAYIGDNSFIGFKATIQHAKIGNNVEIGAHAYIENVIIPDGTAIAPGAIITKAEDIPRYTVPHKNKNDSIARVNTELALAYNGFSGM